MTPAVTALLDSILSKDVPALRRALRALPSTQSRRAHALADLPEPLRAKFEASIAARAARKAALPKPEFAEDLPVNLRREEIRTAIREHQVVIICGETGSGKTTQLPKICLELGRGEAGLIGHTQPRRIAARATADRIAQELHSEPGSLVGYKVRFTDHTRPTSYIKLMTDGILLAETQGDPQLSAYDTIIIDEAHERSLNIDFLLGYLRQLLPKRPDLKVIVTSATLDAERFAKHFATAGKPAPVIEVSGRLYPIEIRYRPLEDDEEAPKQGSRPVRQPRQGLHKDLYDAIRDAVEELQGEGLGDVLVFLPGEREIREAAEVIRKHHAPGTEILTLFARQSAQDQSRVFGRSNGRRVILATNVAETSLTVPGIRYVVDAGLARVNRYSHRNKVELLLIEKIAQSAAKQRAGRCGRVEDGICIRLYEEAEFLRREAHTDPEILRSSLAGVILRMKSLRLGAVEEFAFLDAPTPRMITDGYQLLSELGAIDDRNELTAIGKELAKLPLDPKIGRMILAARDRACLREVLVIAAALSVQDPRERPPEQQGTADQAHARFRAAPDQKDEPKSEFLWYWNLWTAFDAVWRHESSSKQKAWCKQHFLSYMRMREWRDIHNQLHALATEHGWKESELAAPYEAIHKALLTGLLGHIGIKLEDATGPNVGAYNGARGIRFWPHPGSYLAKKAGKWLMAAELIDTSRLYARCIAKIEPEWVEEVGAHLLKTSVYEPHWSKGQGAVRAWQRGVLHGITLYARRATDYANIDPALCRELLIRDGLVQGDLDEASAKQMPFFQHNQRLIAEIERLEHKMRRPDVLVDDALMVAFYDKHLPEDITDIRKLQAWRKKAEREDAKLLYLSRDQLMRHDAAGVTTDSFPASMMVHGQKLKLTYLHEPQAPDDGVTLTVPLAMLNQIPVNRCEWLVPGLLEEKVVALLKTVPPKHRHRLQPISESGRDFMAQEMDTDEPLLRALQRFVEERVSLKLPMESFRAENINPHCLMNFRLIDEHGRVLAQSRSLSELRAKFKEQVASAFRGAQMGALGEKLSELAIQTKKEEPAPSAPEGFVGAKSWDFGELPELLELKVAGRNVVGFPALRDDGDSVSLCACDTEEEAAKTHRKGLSRLFMIELSAQVKSVEKLPGMRELALQFLPYGTEAELKNYLLSATLERTCLLAPLPVNQAEFIARAQQAKARISLVAQELMRLTGQILTEHTALNKKLLTLKQFPETLVDIDLQIKRLLPKDFLVATPFERLAHFVRYLKAISVRIDKLRTNPARDVQLMADWKSLGQPFDREWINKARAGVADPQLEEFRWMLEELRVSLFAQELKTPMPVSVKRLQKIWESRPR